MKTTCGAVAGEPGDGGAGRSAQAVRCHSRRDRRHRAAESDSRALERLLRQAKQCGVKLRQFYVRIGKLMLLKYQRYAHVYQFITIVHRLRRAVTNGTVSPTFSTRGLRQRFWWGEGVRKRVASKGRVGNSPVV
jgi:hypothetical protein